MIDGFTLVIPGAPAGSRCMGRLCPNCAETRGQEGRNSVQSTGTKDFTDLGVKSKTVLWITALLSDRGGLQMGK
jgi:hypothetical protein